MTDWLSPCRDNSYSSTVPISDGIDKLAAIMRRVDVESETVVCRMACQQPDDGIGVSMAC